MVCASGSNRTLSALRPRSIHGPSWKVAASKVRQVPSPRLQTNSRSFPGMHKSPCGSLIPVNLVDSPSPGQVNDFDAVVFQGRNEQALRAGVIGKMVEPAFDTLERNGADLNEWFPGGAVVRREGEASQRQETGSRGLEANRGRNH